VTYYQPHYSIQHLALEYQGSHEVSQALYQAGLDYSFYSLFAPEEPPALLFYDGLEWLAEEAQRNLLAYVESGGKLVVFQRCPRRNQRGQAINLLEIPLPDGIDSQGYMNTFYKDFLLRLGDTEVRLELPAAVSYFHSVPGEAILAARVSPASLLADNILEEYQALVNLGKVENLVVGYRQPRGAGSITYLGIPPSPEVVSGIHRYLMVPCPARPRTKGVHAALYRRAESHYLIVLNSGQEEKTGEVLLDLEEFPAGRYVTRNLLRAEEKIFEASAGQPLVLSLPVSPKNGAILEITPI
jgi:hypothetical protein